MIIFLLFLILDLGFYIYFGWYTTFVIALDVIFGSMGLFFACVEILLTVVAVITFN